MRIQVDWDRCQGIGICESLDPELFRIEDNGNLSILHAEVPAGHEELARKAVVSCPSQALTLTE